ncbi:hypothetical protein KCK33_003508 [Salmonella enterica]|nr:hypothetical protein [Salmonella enterica]EGA0603421.1 hypothetical protein [Salmonella enterica]EHD2148891.1 hypothetical protein [Salmonella enterica]EHK2353380.1 hypothetical protein [Salmonella enterica]
MIKPISLRKYLATKKSIFLCLIICITYGFFAYFISNKQPMDKLTCKADIQIIKRGLTFYGLIDYKSSGDKGIVNIAGNIVTADKKEFIVQRTILFSLEVYGVSPIWTSQKILVSNRETASSELLNEALPEFYIHPSQVTDVDVLLINRSSYLITKSGIPYLICNKYTLDDIY